MFIKNFKKWFNLKPTIHCLNKKHIYFKQRDIWWCHFGLNIGYETDGKGNTFTRPILIVNKLSSAMLFGVPLSTKDKKGTWFVPITFQERELIAVIGQPKTFHINRLAKKMGQLDESDFYNVTKNLQELLFSNIHPPKLSLKESMANRQI